MFMFIMFVYYGRQRRGKWERLQLDFAVELLI